MSAPALASDTAVFESSDELESFSISYLSPSFFYDAAVAVRGVFAEADIGDEDQFLRGGGLLESAQTTLDDAVVVPCTAGLFVFGFGKAEDQQASDAERGGCFGFLECFIDGQIEDAGHRADLFADAFAGAEKERIDERAGLEVGFADQVAHGLGAAETPQPGNGIFHAFILLTQSVAIWSYSCAEGEGRSTQSV